METFPLRHPDMQIRRRTLETWVNDLRAGWGDRAARAAESISPCLVGENDATLHSIGMHLAGDGHSLEDVLAWFHELGEKSRRVRNQLNAGGIAELAAGWADGVLDSEFGAQQIAPLDVLRMRLHQLVQMAACEGLRVDSRLALVVVDATQTDAAAIVLERARQIFCSGESIAVAPNGKVFVLVHREQELRQNTLALAEALRHDAQLQGLPLRVWIEPLAMSAEHIDSHLLGLAS